MLRYELISKIKNRQFYFNIFVVLELVIKKRHKAFLVTLCLLRFVETAQRKSVGHIIKILYLLLPVAKHMFSSQCKSCLLPVELQYPPNYNISQTQQDR